jgi:HNH endonuclease
MLTSEIRQQVFQRAKRRCEYCLVHEDDSLLAHQIDHIIPRQHRGKDELDNLALCCVICNQYKGPNLASLDPQTDELTFFYNPRKHHWEDHFRLLNGMIEGLTLERRATVTIFRFNDEQRVFQRRMTEF